MHKFNFIEHTADIAVELTADSIDELFICGVDAWINAMYEDCDLSADETKSIELSADSLEELLVDFLSEINYLFLTKKWFTVSAASLSIDNNVQHTINAKVQGKDISSSDVEFDEEIKAVTYHQLKIEEKSGEYFTRIIFDI